MDFYDNEIDWDWNINDLEEMGDREAWEDAQAEMQEEHPANVGEEVEEDEVEDGDWEQDEESEDW
jgi:hypothetical protein